MVVGTAAQESGIQNIPQHHGPALGFFQIEPTTHADIWQSYLSGRRGLAILVKSLLDPGYDAVASSLIPCPMYAAAICRIKYRQSPMALPAVGDIPGLAAMYKKIYNTPLGAATEQEFIDNWNRLIAPSLQVSK